MKIKRLYTTFSKMTVFFVLFGLLPLLLLSILFFYRYMDSVQKTAISNYSQINSYFAKNVGEMLDGTDAAMGVLYDYETSSGENLASVLKNDNISESERALLVMDALQSVMEQGEYISSERFADYRGNIYSLYHDPDKTLRNDASFYTNMKIFGREEMCDIKLLGTMEESNICVNSDDFIFVLVRNYMDSSTIEKTCTESLGTMFVDIDVRMIENIVQNINLSVGKLYVYNKSSGQYLYSQKSADYLEGRHPLKPYEQYLEANDGYAQLGGNWIFFQRVGNTDAYTVLLLDNRDVVGDFSQSRTVMILILSFSCAFLLILYMSFSNRMSAPIRCLKEAMVQVENGSMDVRVELDTHDEMEYVADGFNQMVEKLNDYINQVYVARICQKDAELNALKMQIQPHYLYNTLDIIRMTALEENDEKTAELLECLAHQLRYVMGKHNERSCLKEELEAIRKYFVIMKTRYEGRIALHINVKQEDLMLAIPKMLLQPIVENAVKHGLREKSGFGTVAIDVFRKKDRLEIIVMDDGVGMDETYVRHIRKVLERQQEEHAEDHRTRSADRQQERYAEKEKPVGVGMKNVYDRIKLNCGKEYGFTVQSVMGMGTIVTYCLPVWEEMEEHVESGNRR